MSESVHVNECTVKVKVADDARHEEGNA